MSYRILRNAILILPFFLVPAIYGDWIKQSDEYAQSALAYLGQFYPEYAAQKGLDRYDESIRDLEPDLYQRQQSAGKALLSTLDQSLSQTSDPNVQRDLLIIKQWVQDDLETEALSHELMLPYYDVGEIIFKGILWLLDERLPEERHSAAVKRLKKYTGITEGYSPIVENAIQRTNGRIENRQLIGPYRVQVEKSMANLDRYHEGIKSLFERSGLKGWEEAHAALGEQFNKYKTWLEKEILPRTRTSPVLPREIYANNLKRSGVHADPLSLIEIATLGYAGIRSEMQSIASQIAEKRGWEDDDYRAVMRRLKQDQLADDEIFPYYRGCLVEIEDIIRREDIVTLPPGKALIRMASEAESAARPFPHFLPPPLIGNTGELGEFVLPLQIPNTGGGGKLDDFLFKAFVWTLTAHEARPGHEMHFAVQLKRGTPVARVMFSANNANHEGWGIYAETIMQKHMPLEAQLASLNGRLLRAARGFLDPMLNLGMIEPQKAKDFLIREVSLSIALATSEIDRYTYRDPGQATSYFYGLMKFQSIRTRVELALGEEFDQRSFHDFVMAQGMLPLDLLTQVVMEEFIPTQLEEN